MKRNTLLKTVVTSATLGLLLTACGGNGGNGGDGGDAETESYKVGIGQYVSHPSLDATAQGIKDVLEESDYDVEVDEQNAQADQATMNNIIGGVAGYYNLQPDLPLATPLAIAAGTR